MSNKDFIKKVLLCILLSILGVTINHIVSNVLGIEILPLHKKISLSHILFIVILLVVAKDLIRMIKNERSKSDKSK